ncbi:MAG: response regulator transcription factor [Anaerolineae bacterium]
MVMAELTEPLARILVVEDELDTAEVICDLLTNAGFEATAVESGGEALQYMSQNYDLVLLDIKLPDMSGLEVLRRARSESYDQPMIILSGYGTGNDRVAALEDGADDYLSKPFSPEELVARIRAIRRRIEWSPRPPTRLVVRQLELDIARRIAFVRGQRVNLTPIEYAILAQLMRNAGHVVTHEELSRSVWGENFGSDYRVLRVNISRLRQKIEEKDRDPTYIITVPNVGYYIPFTR